MAGGIAPRGSARRGRRSLAEINVTPLVDVMLVLLVVFMISAPLMTAGVSVDLPETVAAPLPGSDEPLAVSIDADNVIYLQEQAVPDRELVDRIRAVSDNNEDLRIFVRGDAAIDYGAVMGVISRLHRAGFRKVSLVTQLDTQGQ